MQHEVLTPDLTFREGFSLWLSHRTIQSNGRKTNASYLAPKTLQDYRVCGIALEKFFGLLPLGKIHLGHLRQYQRGRAMCDQAVASWAKPAGANCIRKEVALLIRVLRAAQCWTEADEDNFEPVRAVENDVPRAMTPEEQHRFLHMASSRTDTQFVYWYSIVALQTTASTKELRHLRLADVFLNEGILQVRRDSAKNKYRIRTIPLVTPDVCWALDCLMRRARDLGSCAPHHYLFPIREKGEEYNPLQPMSDSGLKKRFDRVRRAANLPWLRPYDLRHSAITRMAEAGTPIQVIMSMAGHITLKMQQHYTTISMMSRRGWAQATWGPPGQVSPSSAPNVHQGFGPAPVQSIPDWQSAYGRTGTYDAQPAAAQPVPIRIKAWQG